MKHIGIITFPSGQSGVTPLLNLISIMSEISPFTTIISGGVAYDQIKSIKGVTAYNVNHKSFSSMLLRITSYLSTQIKISIKILRQSRSIDTWIFFIGGNSLIIPMLVAKMCRCQIILTMAGSLSKAMDIKDSGLANIIEYLSRYSYAISDKIVVYSPCLIDEWDLRDYESKIKIGHEHIVDISMFKPLTPIQERPRKVGFIGRFSEEKGVLEFVEAISSVLKVEDDIQFIIIGEGKLHDFIKKIIETNKIEKNVTIRNWVDHGDLSYNLNELRLLLLPSRTEGLPNIMLEALACGTPVLASPVGAIKDYIIHGVNGYILVNNTPECIANSILGAINSENIELTANGVKLIKNEFSLMKSVHNWELIIYDN
jgi:glycosyltransferase involved in cell wall biosynthesis